VSCPFRTASLTGFGDKTRPQKSLRVDLGDLRGDRTLAFAGFGDDIRARFGDVRFLPMVFFFLLF
jgi:hypothetical protein